MHLEADELEALVTLDKGYLDSQFKLAREARDDALKRVSKHKAAFEQAQRDLTECTCQMQRIQHLEHVVKGLIKENSCYLNDDRQGC